MFRRFAQRLWMPVKRWQAERRRKQQRQFRRQFVRARAWYRRQQRRSRLGMAPKGSGWGESTPLPQQRAEQEPARGPSRWEQSVARGKAERYIQQLVRESRETADRAPAPAEAQEQAATESLAAPGAPEAAGQALQEAPRSLPEEGPSGGAQGVGGEEAAPAPPGIPGSDLPETAGGKPSGEVPDESSFWSTPPPSAGRSPSALPAVPSDELQFGQGPEKGGSFGEPAPQEQQAGGGGRVEDMLVELRQEVSQTLQAVERTSTAVEQLSGQLDALKEEIAKAGTVTY